MRSSRKLIFGKRLLNFFCFKRSCSLKTNKFFRFKLFLHFMNKKTCKNFSTKHFFPLKTTNIFSYLLQFVYFFSLQSFESQKLLKGNKKIWHDFMNLYSEVICKMFSQRIWNFLCNLFSNETVLKSFVVFSASFVLTWRLLCPLLFILFLFHWNRN